MTKRGDIVIAVPHNKTIEPYHRLLNMPEGCYIERSNDGKIVYRQFVEKIGHNEIGVFLEASSDGRSWLIMTPRGTAGWIKVEQVRQV